MPTPKKSTAALAASGAFDKNPKRAEGRGADGKPSGALGPCPDYLSDLEQMCWAEIIVDAAPGALTNADNWAVQAVCRLMAMVRGGVLVTTKDGETRITAAPAAIYAQLGQYLDRFGMNPKARPNVQIPKDAAKNEFTDS